MLKYSETHSWVNAEGTRARVGISQAALEELGEVVHAELPKIGSTIESEGEVAVLEPLGSETLVHVTHGDLNVIAKASGRRPPRIGETVQLFANPEALHVFDSATGADLT